ncbi:unnamed protein product [Paramecium pentaurelia]|uniref:Uncharacterized protein n=1 Tax=Paramecium pentaurelia TaxID=43138 RepID=A0A8S1W0C0_9CILI|nr:unnamed protein product [Paramecium pentaurelia]
MIFCDSSFFKQTIAELSDLQITEQHYQNNLIQQKGILDYLIFKLTLEEQMVEVERMDLELIEKEFGELFIEETGPLTLAERIMKIIKDFQIDFSLNIINNKNLSQHQLNIERENQIQIIVKLLKASSNQDLQFFQMPLIETVKDLKEKFHEFKTKYDDQNNRDGDLNELNNENVEDENNAQNKIRTKLSIIINILQLLLIKIRQEKQKLAQLVENVKLFTKSLDVSQQYYLQMYTSFQSCFSKHIENIKESLCTNANLEQQEKESIKEYFSRIQIDTLQSEKQSDNNNSQSTNIVDFLYKLMAEAKEPLKISKWEFQKNQFNQDYLVQSTKKIYLKENDEEYEVKSNQQDQFSIDQ